MSTVRVVFDLVSFGMREEVVAAFRRAWEHVSRPGTWWTGAERVAIAETGRAARSSAPLAGGRLPDAALEAARLVAATPAHTTRSWVEAIVADIGEAPYVELVGVTARVAAVDTVMRLVGLPPEPLPDPVPGDPRRQEVTGLSRRGTWVSMERFAPPPLVLGAVPDEVLAQNDLSDVLYMTGEEMSDDDFRRRGLHRTQIELVAASTSHANECFY